MKAAGRRKGAESLMAGDDNEGTGWEPRRKTLEK